MKEQCMTPIELLKGAKAQVARWVCCSCHPFTFLLAAQSSGTKVTVHLLVKNVVGTQKGGGEKNCKIDQLEFKCLLWAPSSRILEAP